MTLRRSLMISMTAAGWQRPWRRGRPLPPLRLRHRTAHDAGDVRQRPGDRAAPIGPDGALYVTDRNAGSVLRVDRADR